MTNIFVANLLLLIDLDYSVLVYQSWIGLNYGVLTYQSFECEVYPLILIIN